MCQVWRPQQACYVHACVAVGVQAGARTWMCIHSVCVRAYWGSLACMCTRGVQVYSPCRHVHVQGNVCAACGTVDISRAVWVGTKGAPSRQGMPNFPHRRSPSPRPFSQDLAPGSGRGPMRAAREGMLRVPPLLEPLSGAPQGHSGCGWGLLRLPLLLASPLEGAALGQPRPPRPLLSPTPPIHPAAA